MQTPAEITWRNMDPIPHAAERIERRVARLEQFFDRITGCHVVVEAPHQRHRQGNRFEVRVDVTIPGGELSVDRGPGDDNAHTDLLIAVRDAFDAMERQVRRWKDRHSGRPDAHAAPARGPVAEKDRGSGSRQVSATDAEGGA